MSEQKRAYIFQGPGLSRDDGVVASFKALEFAIHRPLVLPAQSATLEMKPQRHDVLVFRASWDPLPEEVLYARQLGSKMIEIGKTLRAMPPEERPTVIAGGRWALALLSAQWTSLKSNEVAHLHWGEVPDAGKGPWTEIRLGDASKVYQARIRGRAVPELSAAGFVPRLSTVAGAHAVGWCFENFLNLFFVDPLSFREGSQLEGFGYENQEELATNTAFLGSLLGMRDA